jgi:hypothetical protein
MTYGERVGMPEHAVLAIFLSRQGVEDAITALREVDSLASDISILGPEDLSGMPDTANAKKSKAPEGATAGSLAGAALGGFVGWLVGIGALGIPGIDSLLAGGPRLAVLAGVVVGSTVGGLTGALAGFEVPRAEIPLEDRYLDKGGIRVTVHTENSEQSRQAGEILKRCGAEDISFIREGRVA